MPARELPRVTNEELALHNKPDDLWLMIDGKVFDVTKFQKLHPGGAQLLQQYGGQDCTEVFYSLHRSDVLDKYIPKLCKGIVEDVAGIPDISDVPYAEPAHLRPEWKSPFLNDSHRKFQLDLRKFIHDELEPEAEECEDSGEYPSLEIYQKMGQFGLLASRIGVLCMSAVPHLGITLPGGVKPKEFDYFHEQIAHMEMGTLPPGYNDGLGAGFCIGCPPILLFANNDDIRINAGREVLLGNKRVCLAISEPHAGSDVANIVTTCTKTPDGKHYIVNGIKKWITNGCFADYFITAARSGNKKGQMNMFFIPRCEGLTTRQMKTSYSSSAGTALIIYDNVKVPVENLLGKEHKGFMCVMANFNHERWFITSQLVGSLRQIVKECLVWSTVRKIYGKPLTAMPVIRQKLAKIIAGVEAIEANLNNVTYQMNHMDYKTQTAHLAGPIALLKYQSTRVAEMVSDESVQIFGGRGITQTGMGKKVERLQRTFKFAAILGGSEEVLADLGLRQSLRFFPKQARL
eukprot:GEMP01006913.1.p1 GENE.GEMP01006913.1~~GEMP01006913.1.p1  ORF type:complete len:517 (+),score=101.14 GEMP01006913.1:120-1670(+)